MECDWNHPAHLRDQGCTIEGAPASVCECSAPLTVVAAEICAEAAARFHGNRSRPKDAYEESRAQQKRWREEDARERQQYSAFRRDEKERRQYEAEQERRRQAEYAAYHTELAADVLLKRFLHFSRLDTACFRFEITITCGHDGAMYFEQVRLEQSVRVIWPNPNLNSPNIICLAHACVT